APPAHELAEQVVEDVGHGGGEVRPEATGRPSSTTVEGRMAELVVGGALLRISKSFVSLSDFLEAPLGVLVPRVEVGMAFLGQSPEGSLQLLFSRVSGYAKNLVIVALGHLWTPAIPSRLRGTSLLRHYGQDPRRNRGLRRGPFGCCPVRPVR